MRAVDAAGDFAAHARVGFDYQNAAAAHEPSALLVHHVKAVRVFHRQVFDLVRVMNHHNARNLWRCAHVVLLLVLQCQSHVC